MPGARLLDELAADPRVTLRRPGEPDAQGRCVVYWMQRAQRALDNPALETAIRAANALRRPVVVFFCLLSHHPAANLRHYSFMMEGLRDTADRLAHRKIGFLLRSSTGPSPIAEVVRFCADVRPAMVIVDENPLRKSNSWRAALASRLAVPVISVDADVIVPCALLGKEQYAARTIRPRILRQLDRFLTPIGNLGPLVAWRRPKRLGSLQPSLDLLNTIALDRSVMPAPDFRGGTTEALRAFARFIESGLKGYSRNSRRPECDGTSRLSPYLHFGQIGPHTVALAVSRARAPRTDRDAFLEQLIVRRELASNFVRFNPRYDRLQGCEPWALRTLRSHARDRRAHLYSAQQLERAETHDPLWNAAQRQMAASGWMHGYVRMYWAKKILEWSRSPAAAYQIAVHLNDKYELDGRDPNGYAGIAWAIGGKHDRPWGPERPIYGKVRYMSYESTGRKFDSRAYIARWDSLAEYK